MPTKTIQTTNLRRPVWWVELSSLLFIELSNWRWSWRSMLVTGTMAPVLSILGIGVFARDSGPEALSYVLTGNLVVSLMFANMGSVQSHMVFLRFGGTLDYFASLPIRRSALIVAMVLSFLLISIPSLAATLVLGNLILKIPVVIHFLLFLIIPLCALPLSGIGALIGVVARVPEESGAINRLVTLIMAGLGPVIIPPTRLPGWFVTLGYLSPATYASSALRQVIIGPITERLWLDVLVLAGSGLVIFWFVTRKLDWRGMV